MLQDPAVKERFAQLAFTPVGDSREQFTAFVKSEIAKWAKVARDSGAKADWIDAIVVGLGAVGSAAAYQLARRGPRWSASTAIRRRTRRILARRLAHHAARDRRGRAVRPARRALQPDLARHRGADRGQAPHRHRRAVDFQPRAQGRTHGRDFFEKHGGGRARHDIEHELLDAYEIREMFPQFNVADNEIGYYEPGADSCGPKLACARSWRWRGSSGRTCSSRKPSSRFSHTPSQVLVRTNRGEYEARHLILAAGAWLPGFSDADLAQYFTVTRQAMFWFAVDAPPERYAPGEFPVWIWELQDRNHVIYGFPQIDGARSGRQGRDRAVRRDHHGPTRRSARSRAAR